MAKVAGKEGDRWLDEWVGGWVACVIQINE